MRSEKWCLRAYLANTQSQQRVWNKNNPLSSWKFQSRTTPPPPLPVHPLDCFKGSDLKSYQISTSVYRPACAMHLPSPFWHTLCLPSNEVVTWKLLQIERFFTPWKPSVPGRALVHPQPCNGTGMPPHTGTVVWEQDSWSGSILCEDWHNDVKKMISKITFISIKYSC